MRQEDYNRASSWRRWRNDDGRWDVGGENKKEGGKIIRRRIILCFGNEIPIVRFTKIRFTLVNRVPRL